MQTKLKFFKFLFKEKDMPLIKVNSLEKLLEVFQKYPKEKIVCDFGAEFCKPCKALAPVFKELSESKKYQDRVFVKIDLVDDSVEDELTSHFGSWVISGLPSIVIFQNGKKVEQKVGYGDRKKFEDWLSANM